MELLVKKQIGRRAYHYTFSGSDLHAVMMEAEHLSFDDVPSCGLCESTDLEMRARVAQGFKYVSIRCRSCRGDLTMGKTKADDKTYFLRRGDDGRYDWKPYTPDAQ